MSDVQRYLLRVDEDKDSAQRIAEETAQSLISKTKSLIDVVQSLGEYINDEDVSIRSKAVNYLSQVISALPNTTLSRQQVQVLCQFLCDRIEDGGAVGGLRKLQSLGRFNREMAIMTFRALVEHFQDLMIRPHAQRLQILELLNDLMLNHRGSLRSLGDGAIVGITDLVSGEKDPRSLMIIFSILQVIMVEWDIAAKAETLFDSAFCYFPITFRPPPDDPYRITAQDLKARLRSCISASSHFAPFAFPQLLEKLDSTSPNVKKDVLQTLTACTTSYNAAAVSKWSITLWDSLKYEILNVQEEDLAEDSLVTLQAIAITLGRDLTSTNQTTHLARFLKPIMNECKEELQAPQHKKAKPAGHILSSLASSSSVALLLVVKAIVPPLLTIYQDVDSIASQKALLEVLVQIFNAAVIRDEAPGVVRSSAEAEHPLAPFKDRLFEVFSQALMSSPHEEVTFRVVALKGLLRLCQVRNYLQNSEIGMVVQYLDEIVLTEDPSGREDVKDEAIQALVEISKSKHQVIMDITFPAFMANLPDQPTKDQTDYVVTLEGLARLSVEKSISDTLIRRLLNKLETVLQNDGQASYTQALLSTIDYVLSRRDLPSDTNLSSYHEKIVVTYVCKAALASVGSGPEALVEAATLEILGRLIARIVCALVEHKRRSVAIETFTLFTQEGSPFIPVLYRQDIPEKQRRTMILSTWILASVGQAADALYTVADDIDFDSLLNEFTRLALVETTPTIRHYILEQIALLVNRSSTSKGLSDALRAMYNPFEAAQIDATPSIDATPIVFWIAKALLLRLSHTQEVLDHLLGLLSDNSCGPTSARGFGLLLASDEIISKQYGAKLRLLSKQKVFSICAPRIAADFRAAEASVKPNYLIALLGILKDVPTEVTMAEIATLLPLLLQSLDLPDQEVKAATIASLAVISQESPGAVEGHMSSLVNRLLQAASKPRENIAIFPGRVKGSVLLPYRAGVIKGILPVLDDAKRHVRKMAVECRATWTNMDEPDQDA
ncbi:MAG: hypothetical protein LQ339_005722 [Xanthoria mediterranea]|nr:MAG: hypothetical protein LQ339_005722 [Xanthoria mediterranea]